MTNAPHCAAAHQYPPLRGYRRVGQGVVLALLALGCSRRLSVESTEGGWILSKQFVFVTAVMEINDTSVLVLDSGARVLYQLALPSTESDRVAVRKIRSPLRGVPAKLFRTAGGEIVVSDRSFTEWWKPFPVLRRGTIGTSTTVVPTDGSRILGVDSSGNSYAFSRFVIRTTEVGPIIVDTVALLRWRPMRAAPETLAYLQHHTPPGTRVQGNLIVSPRRLGVGSSRSPQAIVAPSGVVAILRSAPYVIEFTSAAGVASTGVIDSESVAYHEAYRRHYGKMRGTARTTVRVRRDSSHSVEFSPANPLREDMWADLAPPFLDGTPVFAPEGSLWVQVPVQNAATSVFEAFAIDGPRIGRYSIAPHGRLVAVGARAVYLADDDGDFERLRLVHRGLLRALRR